jgi:hypothetical protein
VTSPATTIGQPVSSANAEPKPSLGSRAKATAPNTAAAKARSSTMLGSAMRRLRVKYSASSQFATAMTTHMPTPPMNSMEK